MSISALSTPLSFFPYENLFLLDSDLSFQSSFFGKYRHSCRLLVLPLPLPYFLQTQASPTLCFHDLGIRCISI